jgi:trehalose 6-phosphate phosphatase
MDLPEELSQVLSVHAGGGRLVLLFDYDGTLAPFVDRPELASLPPRMHALLGSLVTLPRLVVGVLSGRELGDLKAKVALPKVYLCGSAGMELDLQGVYLKHPQGEFLFDEVAVLCSRAEREIKDLHRAWVEKKLFGFTVHYRLAAPEVARSVRERTARVLADFSQDLRVTEGALAIEVTPRTDWTKGTGVRRIVEHSGSGPMGLLYAGDGANDDDAFRTVKDLGGITVGVGPSPPRGADIRVTDTDELLHLLEGILASFSKERSIG